jgi:hypothetical protein
MTTNTTSEPRTSTATSPASAATNAVTRFLDQIEAGAGIDPTLFAHDAEIDAVVPNWRMAVRTGTDIAAQFSQWYAQPGCFEELSRVDLPDGELVEFTLTWTEHGTLHAARQVHHLVVDDTTGRIATDRLWCGGRWPAPLLAEMASA